MSLKLAMALLCGNCILQWVFAWWRCYWYENGEEASRFIVVAKPQQGEWERLRQRFDFNAVPNA